MKKKIIFILILILIVIGTFTWYHYSNEGDTKEKEVETTDADNNDNNSSNNNTNILVLYFSATNNTKTIAEYIKEITNGDIIRIIPTDEYTDEDLDYTNSNSRATIEQNDDNARPEIAGTIDIENYDVIYLGYPIWWGDVPKIILTLLDTYDFTGKTVIPFSTSGGSDITTSTSTLKNYNNKINWYEGKRFSANATIDEVKTWIESLNY